MTYILIICSCVSAFASFAALRNWRLAAADAERTRKTLDALSRVYWKVAAENVRQRAVIGAAINKLNEYIEGELHGE